MGDLAIEAWLSQCSQILSSTALGVAGSVLPCSLSQLLALYRAGHEVHKYRETQLTRDYLITFGFINYSPVDLG